MALKKWVLSSLLPFLFFEFCISIGTITPSQSLKDGDLLVSSRKTFALGFFSPRNPRNRYVGIWYNKVPGRTVVWVANRDNPINGTSGVLAINKDGNLVIYNDNNQLVPLWQTNVSTAEKTTGHAARLLDSGNLALFGGNNIEILWQSFDYPTNTFLPGMKLGLDRRTGLDRFLTSWKSADNPATGEYSCRVDPTGVPQLEVVNKGSIPRWRSEPFAPGTKVHRHEIFDTTYVYNDDEISVRYDVIDSSIVLNVLDEFGSFKFVKWFEDSGRWIAFYTMPIDHCAEYGWCGVNQFCDSNTGLGFECACLPGYELRPTQERYPRNESDGCVKKRKSLSMCGNGEGFVKVENMMVPDTSSSKALGRRELSLEECRKECLRECSCTAFTSSGVGDCITWYGNLMDTRIFNGGQELYVRDDTIELAQHLKKHKNFHGKKVAIGVTSAVVMLVLIISLACWSVKNRERDVGPNTQASDEDNIELPIFDMTTVAGATNKFSNTNKIGEGGFGLVYKGQLPTGKEIAVKCLSVNSKQGISEFKNEVALIAKLQHRNLVRLLGCCIHGEERMLIYEYMCNGSLDSLIFDRKNTRKLLTWRQRLDIIVGISRGLLYLHRDSRLRVIHRDLKASNVLLDSEMNPKISDFGLARTFGGDQSSAITKRVVGTYGYMSPEYAVDGLFSMKSDVFSFGVLILEIISGQRNRLFHHGDHDLNLLGHAWKLWIEGNASKLLDPMVEGSVSMSEVLKFIQVGLLCVQKLAGDRPTMSAVLLMLVTETAVLSKPKQPGFYIERSSNEKNSYLLFENTPSINEVTMTLPEVR